MQVEVYFARASRIFGQILHHIESRTGDKSVRRESLLHMENRTHITYQQVCNCEAMFQIADAVFAKYKLSLPPQLTTLVRAMEEFGADKYDIDIVENLVRIEVSQQFVSNVTVFWRTIVRSLGDGLTECEMFSPAKWAEWNREKTKDAGRKPLLKSLVKYYPVMNDPIKFTQDKTTIDIDVYTASALLSQTPFVPNLNRAILHFEVDSPIIRAINLVCSDLPLDTTQMTICKSIRMIYNYFHRVSIVDDSLFGAVKK